MSHTPDLSRISSADRAAVEDMPKVELHVHLEGSIKPQTMMTLAERNEVDIGATDEDALRARYRFDQPDEFFALFMAGLSVLREGEDFELVIEELTTELLEQNVLHAEVTTTPWNHLHRGVSVADYTAALNAGQAAAARRGLSIVWIHDIPRGFEFEPYELTMGYVLGSNLPRASVGFGLGGTEVGYACRDFAEQFEAARDAGLHLVPHAGETDGAASVREAVELLGAERIGHGIRCLEDLELTRELAESQLHLEVCPTSNVALRVVADYESHPLGAMIAAGLNVSVGSDDPAYFSTSLTQELLISMAYAGCTVADLKAMQQRAAEAAFLPPSERQSLGERLAS